MGLTVKKNNTTGGSERELERVGLMVKRIERAGLTVKKNTTGGSESYEREGERERKTRGGNFFVISNRGYKLIEFQLSKLIGII